MAHITELSSALQTALNRDKIYNWPEAQLILDPDGDAIDLSSRLQDSEIVVSKEKKLNPDEELGKISISELTLKFKNDSNYFSPEYIDGPFYHVLTKLYADYTHGGTTIDVPKNFTIKAGLTLVISEGKYSASAIISSINTSDTYYDRVTFTAALSASYDFSAGATVETKYRVGEYITIGTILKGAGSPTDIINQYKGVIAALPVIKNDGAYLTIQDMLCDLLAIQMKANTTKSRLSNTAVNLESSLSITRVDESTGSLSEGHISINANYCKIGAWNMEFTSATEYTVKDPGGIIYTGNTTSAFYAGDSTIYQLTIPTSAWSGTFETGDQIDFSTFCTICYANESTDGNTVPLIIERILTENYGAGLSSSEYDSSALETLKTDYAEFRAGITFGNKLSVLKAIEIMLRHINAAISVQNSGVITFTSYKPQPEPASPNALSPTVDIQAVDMDIRTRYRRVTGLYDYSDGEFNKEFSYPYNEGEPHIEVKLPAFTANERIYAEAIVRRMYTMWEKGLKTYSISEKWNYGIGFDINDQFRISSLIPDLETVVVEIFGVHKCINRPSRAEVKGYDISHNLGQYFIIGESKLSDGRVLW